MTDTCIANIGDLSLREVGLLPDAKLAYTSYGRLAPDGRNAVLVTHGFTSSHRFIESGGWATLFGPGRPVDTDRFFVVSSNMLGSVHGSSAPASLNPASGRPYGPDFPAITVADMVSAQKRLLDGLGVRELVAVLGPSYGGIQAFTWGVEFPDFMRGLVPVETALHKPNAFDEEALLRGLAKEPHWNGGHHYAHGGAMETMTQLRIQTLRRYGIEKDLALRFKDEVSVQAEIRRQAVEWAERFDPNSLLTLARALNRYDVRSKVTQIRAKVLYILSRTDLIFPPSLALTVMPALAAAGVDARYFEIDSEHGHLASDVDAAQWGPALAAFLAELAEQAA